MKAFIKYVSVYLPPKILTNEELSSEFPEWSIEKISEKVGIKQRHISADDEFVSDMASTVAIQLFEEHNVDKSTIDFLLVCTQSPDYNLPTTACIVQEKIGLETTCGALDFNQGCSGYIYGLSLAKGLIYAGIARNILLITSETYTKYLHPSDKGNRTIFGDASAATLISTSGLLEIKEFELGTNGEGACNLIVKNSGSKSSKMQNLRNDEFGNIISDDYLYMNGGEIFNFTLKAVPKLVSLALEKNQVEFENIDFFIFHQANKYMLTHLKKKIGILDEKFVIDLSNYGNTVSSTIPIALNNLINNQKILSKQKLLLAGFGVGYSWGSVVIESTI